MRNFEDMTDPSLADRLRAFEMWLDSESCETDTCKFLSNMSRMCAACRIKMHFYHCIYNAEAYEDGPGRIPRKMKTFKERVDEANAQLKAEGSKRRVGYNEGARYPYHVANNEGQRTFGTYDRLEDCLAAIATLDTNNLETEWYETT